VPRHLGRAARPSISSSSAFSNNRSNSAIRRKGHGARLRVHHRPRRLHCNHNHVVTNADKVTVIFQENSRHTAKVIGRDEKTDIALLKIDSSQTLPYVTWGTAMTPR